MNTLLKTRIIQSKPLQLIIQTLHKWHQDECLEMGAALSYYALFSLFPLLLVILSIVGFLLGSKTNVYNQVLGFAQSSLPSVAYGIVESTLSHLHQSSMSAGVVSFLLLFFTASSIFGTLAHAVDKIWQVQTQRDADRRLDRNDNDLITNVLNFLQRRILALSIVLGISALMLVSLLSELAIKIIIEIAESFDQAIELIDFDILLLLQGLEAGITFLLLSLALMVLFKMLPSTRVTWGDVWLGAVITAALFRLVQYLASNGILQIASRFLSYGVVGSVMVLMLWIYIVSQLFFLGSEFTYIYAHLFGSRRQRAKSIMV